MSRRDFRFCSELIERGIFGFFFLLWIFLVYYLFIQSNSSYFSELGDSWNQEHNILFYETFQNKTDTGGPYHVYKSTVYIGGFVCGRSQHAIVYFPSNLQQLPSQQKYPLISFAHGFRAGGEKLDKDYSQLLIGLASWGFIIVAPESAPKKYCEEQYQDQLRIFEYLETNKIRHRAFASLDSSAYYGVLGHSMGGRSSIISATKEEYRIGAAAALHPVYTKAVTHVKV
jgi:dipeptidyl aminopeptidase/acylaminoacyl peptidase